MTVDLQTLTKTNKLGCLFTYDDTQAVSQASYQILSRKTQGNVSIMEC